MSEHLGGAHGGGALQEHSYSDVHDDEQEVERLEENAYGKIPELAGYKQPWEAWETGTIEKAAEEVRESARELDELDRSEEYQSEVQDKAGIDDPEPRCSAKACKLAACVIGLPLGLGAVAVIGAAIGGVFNAAKQMEGGKDEGGDGDGDKEGDGGKEGGDKANRDALYAALAKAAMDADSEPFWKAYKVAVTEFKAGLAVQKEAAAYVLSVSAPGFFMTYGTKPFLDSKAYQAQAKTIADKVLAPDNKESLLYYDLVHQAPTRSLALNIKGTDIDDRPRVLRLGLLLVVIEELLARAATTPAGG